MHIIAIIQARMGSTRLPAKVLLPLGDKFVLQWVVERTQSAIPDVVIATTEEPADEAIAALGRMLNVPVVKYGTGAATNDVVARFCRVLEQHPCDGFLRITADCPLIEPVMIRAVLEDMRVNLPLNWPYWDCSCNVGYADGLDVEGMDAKAYLAQLPAAPEDREHVTTHWRNWAGEAAWVTPGHLAEYRRSPRRYRLTLDTQHDYERLQRIWAEVPHGPHGPDALVALNWLKRHPEWWGDA